MDDSADDDGLPTVSDGLVALRSWAAGDARFLSAAMADASIRRYNGAHDQQGRPVGPMSRIEAASAIGQFRSHAHAFATTGSPAGVVFAITDTLSDKVVGCCGVDDWTGEDVAQVGYWLAPESRGRGYATRALVLLTRWLFDRGAARVFMTIVAGNAASVAVARRAGFVYEGTMRAHGVWLGERQDVAWFATLPHEWPFRFAER